MTDERQVFLLSRLGPGGYHVGVFASLRAAIIGADADLAAAPMEYAPELNRRSRRQVTRVPPGHDWAAHSSDPDRWHVEWPGESTMYGYEVRQAPVQSGA